MHYATTRSLLTISVVAVFMTGTALAHVADSAAVSAQGPTYAFVDVTVVPMDRERLVEHQTVVVRDGRIVAIGPTASTPVPQGATRIDGQGKFLMPGLAEMHAHIPDWGENRRWTEQVLFLYLANGITTIRGMLGAPSHLELRERVETEPMWSPRIYTSGPSVNGRTVQTVEAAETAATEQKAAGYDFIKIHPGLTREVFNALDATADRVGISFSGHVPTDVGVMRALQAKYASIDHLDGYIHLLVADDAAVDRSTSGGFFGLDFIDHVDESKIATAATETREAGVWIVPTQILMESLLSEEDPSAMVQWPQMRYVPRRMVQRWVRTKRGFGERSSATAEQKRRFVEVRRKLIKALHDAGVGLLQGSDAPQWWNVPGYSALDELETYVAAGLTAYEAIRTGTHNVAVFFGTEAEAGTVTVGKRADLILLDANPLADIANVKRQAGVMVRGRWLGRDEIEERLEEIAMYHKQ